MPKALKYFNVCLAFMVVALFLVLTPANAQQIWYSR